MRDGLATASMGFHTTHWTVVLAAQGKAGPTAREALASLCSTYWFPLYAFVRRRGASPHEAQDLTQEFFRQFLERDSLSRVRPAGGKFRSFLLVCLKNFLANQHERAQAKRRGGGHSPIAWDAVDAETRYRLEPADHRTPESEYERHWAFAVLERALKELEREYAAGGRREIFEDYQGFLPGGRGQCSRAALAAKRGISVGAVDVGVHRLKRRLGALLREQVARTVSSEAEVEDELRCLISLLSCSTG